MYFMTYFDKIVFLITDSNVIISTEQLLSFIFRNLKDQCDYFFTIMNYLNAIDRTIQPNTCSLYK